MFASFRRFLRPSVRRAVPPASAGLATAFLLLLGVVASGGGCGDPEGGAVRLRDDSTHQLKIWHGFEDRERPVFLRLVREFEEIKGRELGRPVSIEVSYTPFPQMETKLKTAAMAHQTPDLCFFDALNMVTLAYGKAIVAIDELEGFRRRGYTWQSLREEFVPAAYDTCVVNVKGQTNLYGLPGQTTCVALFYNKALFRRFHDQLVSAGLDPTRPPATWGELKQYARVMTSDGSDGQKATFGFAMNRSLWWSFPFLNTFRARLVTIEPDGRVVPSFTDERSLAMLGLLQEIATSGYEGGAWRQGGLTPDQGFLEGVYAMCINGPWKVAEFLGAGLDFGITLIPRIDRADAERLGIVAPGASEEEYLAAGASASNLGGQNLIMFKTAPDKELALDFMLWFTSEDVQRRWCSELTQIPVRLAAQEGLELKNAEYFGVFVQQSRTTIAPPLLPLFGKLETDIVNKELDLLFNGRKTPEQTARAICEQMERDILDKVNSYLDE